MSTEIEVDPIDVMDISVREEALREDERFTASEKVCMAALDYHTALISTYFAACHGGVDGFKQQLLGFIDGRLASDMSSVISKKTNGELTTVDKAALAATEYKAQLSVDIAAAESALYSLLTLAVRWMEDDFDPLESRFMDDDL